MVRKGRYDDIDRICEMAEQFWRHTPYDEPFCYESTGLMAEHCIDNELASMLEIDGVLQGFAGGIVSPLLCNHSVLVGTEVAWWVNPDHRSGRNGISLLKHLEKLAKEKGVKYWSMAYMQSSMPEEMKGIYERLGYVKNETAYTRKF